MAIKTIEEEGLAGSKHQQSLKSFVFSSDFS